MKMRFFIQEISNGFVTVDVPDGASEEEITNIAEQAYFDGNTYWSDGDWNIIGMQKD